MTCSKEDNVCLCEIIASEISLNTIFEDGMGIKTEFYFETKEESDLYKTEAIDLTVFSKMEFVD